MIAPSILSADFANIQRDVEMINHSGAELIHLDIMDGLFVPNISYGFPVVEAIARHTKKEMDAHLMIVDPDRYISRFAGLGVKWLSVHYEACPHLNRTINLIRSEGMKAGVAINPHTPVSALEYIIEYCDFILIMSVNPGYGAQSFIANSYRKIEQTKEMIISKGLKTLIEVDGGVNLENAPKLRKAGADILVAGNAVFSAPNPIEAICKLI